MQTIIGSAQVNSGANVCALPLFEGFDPELGVATIEPEAISQAAGSLGASAEPPTAPGSAVRFEQSGSNLTAVEITRDSRSPVMVSLHRALFALGIIVSSYHVRTHSQGLTERVVIERLDGGSIEGNLSVAAKAVILPIALQETLAKSQIASV